MSNIVLIIGESGSGKSTSIRNLSPEETFIINVIGKPLPFKGYKSKYKKFSQDNLDGNYYSSDNYARLKKVIKHINEHREDIKTIIVDDFQYLMANEFMRKALERGYDKFSMIAKNAWELIDMLGHCRDDLNCFVLSHSDSDSDGKVKCKTIGKMLSDKITIEGMFTVVFHSVVEDDQYSFLTQTHGSYLAKSPAGMFEDLYIPNDLQFVIEKMNEYQY